LRDELATARVLTTRVVWFEDDPPERYPEASLGVATTHDLPTVAGIWTGADARELAALDRPAPEALEREARKRLDALVRLPPGADVVDVVERVHQRLAAGPSVLVLGTLEDLTGVVLRPNVPGTTEERPNWSQALPIAVDDLPSDPAVDRGAAALRRSRGPAQRGD
jgi:4-alpha-glucanotransferase